MTEQATTETTEAKTGETTFTQADVDRLLGERVKRVEAKYADYDQLKAKAGESASVEDRLVAMEKRATGAEARALRNDIATRYGISVEDRDLFLNATEPDSLEAQAKRLAERTSDQRKQGNVASKEGANPNPSTGNDMREFARSLFKTAA